ncbi:MAG: AAA family ATPase [Planctomycetota bacterium]
MRWDELLGHQLQRDWFTTALANQRLATSFLFVGPSGIGKRQFARLLAKSLLCRSSDSQRLEFCDACEDCAQVDASTHPDLLEVGKPADRAYIPIELLIGEREKRMREGLCHDISLRPYSGRRKIAILDDADHLNVEGANCLLKTLEEPPVNSVLILIGSSLQRQLPTIRSRCQSILFQALTTGQITELLTREVNAHGDDDAEAIIPRAKIPQLAAKSDGTLDRAMRLVNEDLQAFGEQLISRIQQTPMPVSELAKEFGSVVDAAGKDNRAKRDRMRSLFEMAAEHFRGQTLGEGQGTDESSLRCWKRCLTAMEQVERNANQAGLIEAWSYDIAGLSGR